MTNKEFLISKLLETMLSNTDDVKPKIIHENDTECHLGFHGGRPVVSFLRDKDTEFHLIHEYNPTFMEVLSGKYKSPFLVYECNNGDKFCVTIKQHSGSQTLVVDELITEKEDHERFNAIGIHVDAILMGINQNQPIESKIDTGAECCSLGVEDISLMKSDVDPEAQKVKFTFNERQYTMKVAEMISVSTADGGIEYRPTVLFDIKINGHLVSEVQVNLNDRSHMQYKFLIGLNLLEKCDLVIDPSITEEEIQTIHNVLNAHSTIKLDGIDIVEQDKKPLVTRQIMELMLANPDITFKDILSMSRTDAINAVNSLQA